MKRLSIILAAFLTIAVCQAQTYVPVRTYDAPEANQGVAVDASSFYAIGNSRITKYSRSGGSLATFTENDRRLIKHFDGGIVVGKKLYCSHSNFPGIPMASSIEVFDTKTLKHLESISFGIEYGSCTWIVPGKNCWFVCFAHYDKNGESAGGEIIRDASWTQIIKFNRKWQKQCAWILPPELVEEIRPMSLSGGLLVDGKLWCTGHDAQKVYVLEFPPYGTTLRWTGTIDIPFKGQGIAIDGRGHLWGIDRKDKCVIEAERLLTTPSGTSSADGRILDKQK
ncbi:MAG: hypothetical protein J5835_00640 [Bacteroidales bacterium]|nr:hypothetical protein [Bacteroidales bacterium]